MTRRFVIALSLFGLASALSAQQTKVLAPHKFIAPRVPKSLEQEHPRVPRSMVGGFWMIDANRKASISLKNGLDISSITVVPSLYLSNGVRYKLSPVTLEASGTSVISINDSLSQKGISSWATLSGYVEVEYTWAWDPLCITVTSTDPIHSVIFSSSLQPSVVQDLQIRLSKPKVDGMYAVEGMWWKPESGVTGFVGLSNTTADPIDARVQVSDNESKPLVEYKVRISPYGTKVVPLQVLQQAATGSTGGLRVLHTGTMEGLLINGELEDQTSGYSANLPFHYTFTPKPQQPGQELYAELGLMTGAADPMMRFPADTVFTPFSVARNVSNKPVSVTPTLYWMQAGSAHSARLQAITLPPMTTLNFDVPRLLASARLQGFNGSANLLLESEGDSRALLLASGSVDQKNTYVFQVPPHGIQESTAKSISYWSTANGDDTMVTIWNPADESQDYRFTLMFKGGHYQLPLHLEARATRSFDISEIIQTQIPDEEGNLIPPTVHEGSAKISGMHADNEEILVGLDAGTYNVRKATCTYYCISCDGEVLTYLVISPFNVGTGKNSTLTFTVQDNHGNQWYSSGTWSNSNTTVATVAAADWSEIGLVTAKVHGTSTFYASGSGGVYNSNYCYVDPSCPYNGSYSGSGGGTVTDNTPIVTGISPSDWTSGTTTPGVTFTGQYFGTNVPTLTFSPSGGITYSLVSYNDSQIVANITVASGTPNEDVTVAVTNNGYGGLGFQSGGGSVSPTSSAVYATVHAPINSPEVTVIAWVNGAAPDLVNLPAGANSTLTSHLNSSGANCAAEVFAWAILGITRDLYTQNDRDYANAFLVAHSANSAPPSSINPNTQLTGGNYRLFNDWGNSKGAYNVGVTPDPCKFLGQTVSGWLGSGQPSKYMGSSGTSGSGKVYQIAEGRIGKVGQWGSQTINQGRTVPYIYDVIEFDTAGNFTVSDHATFPTYYFYKSGVLQPALTVTQSTVKAFVTGYDASNEAAWSPVP